MAIEPEGSYQRGMTVMKDVELDKLPRVNMGRRELLVGLAAGTVFPLAGCATDGDFGQVLVSDAQIQQASEAAWADTKRRERLTRDPAKRRRVERVGQRIVPATGMGQYDWEFVVFESEQQNAWVLPNGKVAFYSGLLDIMDNDDQIATVMGHEAGHLRRNHAAQRARQQAAAGIGLAIVNAGLGAANVENPQRWSGILGMGVTYGVLLPYSRQHELEADVLGVDYMARANYRPSQALSFWQTMTAQNARRPSELMSTHPSDSTRIENLRRHISDQGYG